MDRVVSEQIMEIGPLHVSIVYGGNLHIRASKGVAKSEASDSTKPRDSYSNLAMVKVQIRG